MGLFDRIKEFVAGEEEAPVTAASVLAKVREKYPHLQGIDDLSLSQSLYKKDPAKFSYLKTYAPDTTVPPALVPKSMRDDAFYKANPQEGTKDALKVIEQVKAKFPKYKSVDAKKLAVALETKNPTMFAGLSKKLMPGQTAIPKGETEAATIPLIPSGTMGATKPVSPVQVTPPVRPIETKPEPKVRPSVTSISPEEAKLPDGTKPLKFKNGIEAYLAVEKLAKPTLVEYPGRHGQTIRRIMTTEIPSFPPPPEDKGKDLVGKIVGKEEAFARGVGVSGVQIPELAYGATALVADSAEKLFGSGTASRVKDWALRGYQRASKVSEEVHGDEVKSVVESWKEAKKGNLDALGDWLSYWSGYAAGQLGESAAVAFLGGLVGSVVPGPGTAAGAVAGVTAKTATKGVIRGALERLVERQAVKLTAEGVAAAEAKKLAVKQIATAIGAVSAIGAYAVVQEGGSIYPDAVKKAEEDGRKLNGYDLGRVWGTTLVAAGAEGLGDMLGLGFLTGKVRIPGRLGKVARIVGTAASGGLADGGTEAIQTAVERVGAGRKPFDQEGIQAIIESAAAGAIPGLGAGGVGATISGQPRANVQSLAATQEASPELLSYLDRVEKINREQASDVTESQQKEDVTKGPARAEFIGYQEGLPEDTPIPLYNVMGESPRALSTVGSEELKSLGIETPKTPSFEEWKAGGDVTEGQVSAKKLIEKLASANEISDAVAVEFVKHITPTGENFYKSYGEEFSPEKFRVLGATIPQYTQNGLNFAIKLAQGAKESTGAHEMFHAMKQMGFFSQDEMRVLEGRFGNEEKIADALGEYATRRTGAEAQSRIKAIFDRFLDFVKRVGSMLVGRGWTRAEDIFESVVKGRPEKIGNQKSGHPMFKAEPKDRTQTPAFKRWFGDSKVVDESGKPLVVYKAMYPYDWRKQGSTEPLSVISRPTEFPAFNKGEPGVKIAGFFGDQNVANRFAAGAGNGQAIYPVYLSLKNPYVVDANGATAGSVQFGESGKAFRDAIRSNQYDGAIIRNTSDEGTIYVALEPTQIKSATGNIGTFDPNNPSILYQAERIPPTPEKISEAASQITTITPPKNESDVTKVGGQSLSKDVNEIPIFQGGKRELASRIGAAALRNWTDQERRSVSSMTDAFGGSGGWGLWLANHIFPGVKTIRLNELDGDRLLKIKYFHDHGNELRKAFYQSGLDERLASLYDEMAKAGVQSGSALGNRISTIRNSITDETQRAILAAIEDYVSHQRGVRTVNDAVDAAARDADYVYKAAAKFRARGGKFEYVNGDAYKLETPQGPNHVVVFDPPYYGTAGYGTGTVPLSIYRMTGDFLRKTAANKNNIVYTDSLWMAKPANDLPSDWRQGALDVWAKIKQAIGRVGAAAGKVGAGRREVIGLHNAFKAGEVIDVEPRREENAGGGVAPSGEVGGDEQPGRGGGEAPVGDAGGGVAGRTEGEAAPIHGEAAGRGSQLTPETPGSPYFAAPSSNAHRRVPPPVLEALQSAEGKLNDLTVGQAGELSTLAPTRAMEVMDGKRFGLMKDHFLKPIQDADKSFQIELKSMRAEAKAVLHGLTADERRSVYNAIDLKHPIHSDEVKRAVDFLRKTYDDLLDRINTARAAAGKDPVQKRQNYITHYQELSVLNDILDMIGLNMTEVPNSMLTISMFTKPNSPYFQFAKRRLGEQTERDAEQAFLRYLEPALRTIHFSPATKNARDIIEYKVKIPSEYEGGKIDTVSLFGIRYPNAYRYLTNYLNVVSGKRPILDKIFPQGAAIAGVMNKLFAAGSIGGNISTVITQAASLRNTIAETGLFAFKGQMLINTPEGYRFFKKNSRIGLGRQYEPSTKGTRLLGSKALAKTHEAVSDLISIPVGLFDREMVGGAFLAGYFKGRSIGLSEADAIRYGDDVAERTQASANIVDRPPINTGKLKTALGQFQTFVYNEWSQIRNDMVKKAVRGENSKQGYGDGLSGIREGRDVGFKRFLYFSIAAIILSSMYDEADLPNPLKQEAFSLPFGNHHVNTVFQHIVNQIPFVGNIRFGGPPVVQMIKLSVDVFGHVRDRKIALRRLQNIGLRLIPGGGQISKSINAHRYFFKVPPQTMADKVRGYMFGPRRWEILNDDMRWLKENAGRLGLTRSKAYQYLNRTSTRSLLADTEKERNEARAKVESYAKRLRAMAEAREAELAAREERRKARLAARR